MTPSSLSQSSSFAGQRALRTQLTCRCRRAVGGAGRARSDQLPLRHPLRRRPGSGGALRGRGQVRVRKRSHLPTLEARPGQVRLSVNFAFALIGFLRAGSERCERRNICRFFGLAADVFGVENMSWGTGLQVLRH